MPISTPGHTRRRRRRAGPSPLRRARILEAAERLFSRHGYRAVSMARIAEEAGFSKATVYAYFADRDDVFRGVAEDVAARLVAVVGDALAGTGTTVARVTAALRAKDVLIYELAAASPHAAELFEAKDRLVRARFDETDTSILRAIAAALEDGRDRGFPPARLARILVRASRGLATRAESTEVLAEDIAVVVERLIG